MPRPSCTCRIPRRTILSSAIPLSARPSNRTSPLVGFKMPEMVRNRVDLPAPLAPMSATTSPSLTSRLTPRNARMAPYPTCTLSTRSMGSLVLGAKVGFDDALISLDRLRRAFGDLLPEVQHRDDVRDLHDHRHIVLDQQDRLAEGPHSLDQFVDLVRLAGIHAGRRLVEQQEIRVRGERARHLQAPLLAEGDRRGGKVTPVAQA